MAGRLRAGGSGIALLVLGVALSACGGSQDGAVREVAEDFYAAMDGGDGQAACELLVPATRAELEQSSGKECAAAILEESSRAHADSGTVEVFGTMAQVSWDGDTAFLARMPNGWRMLALACEPGPADRYDCTVKGG